MIRAMISDNLTRLNWIPQTKLRPPQLRAELVARPRLVATLTNAVASKRLILVSAPAGYGKTTLLASFVQQYTDLPTAWVLLDEEENHLTRFLQAMIAALQQLAPDCGTLTQTALASLSPPEQEFRSIVGVLVNEILTTHPDPFLLVLDDLHTLRAPDVYLALDYLLNHLPEQMHILIASRYDPPLALSRLRANNHLAEIRMGDLRFNQTESRALLNDKMHLGLTSHDLETIVGQTEGWITGLHLSAGSLERLSVQERSRFLTQLAQHHHHIFEFLAEEVLDHQDEPHRIFLLQTSILVELSPSLCRAVTARLDAPLLLVELYRRNLCLTDAGSTRENGEPLYRYHALFREFLLRRLEMEMPTELPLLHQRAAAAIRQPARQVGHYLAAEQWTKAAQLIEQLGHGLLHEGAVNILKGWIERLPASVQQERPYLLYFRGALARQQGALNEAESLLEQALTGFTIGGNEAGQGEVLIDLANLYSARHDFRRQPEMIRQALTKPLPSHSRVQLLVIRAWQSLYQGNWEQTDRDIEEAIQVTLASQDRAAFNILGLQLRDPFIMLPDGMARMERYSRQALARHGEGVSPIQAGAHSLLSIIHLLRGEIEQGEEEVRKARAVSTQLGGFVFIDLGIDIAFSLIDFMRGDYAHIEQYWQARLPQVEALPAARQWLIPLLLWQGRACLLQGRRADADAILARMDEELTAQSLPEVKASHTIMTALLASEDQHFERAEELLQKVVETQQTFRHIRIFHDARLPLTTLYLRWNRPDQARAYLLSVLEEYQEAGTPGFFLYEGKSVGATLLRFALHENLYPEFVQKTLRWLGIDAQGDNPESNQASAPPRPLPIPHTTHTLTPREVEVLHLIAAGDSNRIIADKLVVTERTVKSHVTNILRKFDVSSRTQAAAQARSLGML